MKKIRIIVLILILTLFIEGCSNNMKSKENNKRIEKATVKKEKNNFVSYNGNLKLDGVNLVNQYGEKIQLKGMSSHGLQWFGDFVNEDNIKILKDEWNSNVFRLAMYTEEGGYLSNKNIKEELIKDIDMIIDNDMYVIVDWHILSDNNPSMHLDEALKFFDEISSKYKDSPNIIYEICNEPHDINWVDDVKPYAEKVIKTIRKNSKDSIIIVGTNTWCQDVDDVIGNKIDDDNTMYSLHFYTGTHSDELRKKAKKALDNDVPIFVSEWGTSKADGSNGVYLEEAQKWVDFMKKNNLSFTNWSLSDKDESSAALKPGTSTNGFSDDDLTESGKFIKEAIKGN